MRSRASIPRGPRIATAETTARALRREIAAHNRQVLLIGIFTLLFAAVLWAVLYAVSAWFAVLVFVVGTDGARQTVPQGFSLVFAVAALCSLAYAWLDARLSRHALPPDDKTFREIVADFLLALPRITLAGWGTLRAWLQLSRAERLMAAELLHRLHRERRVPLQSVPQDIPGEPQRLRILFALQILRAIEIRRSDNSTLISLDSQRPRSLFAA